MNSQQEATHLARSWPGYRTIWRWHFYAGLFALPFVTLARTTGSIYLFRPQIEAWLDRLYDHLGSSGAAREGRRRRFARRSRPYPDRIFTFTSFRHASIRHPRHRRYGARKSTACTYIRRPLRVLQIVNED